MKYILTFMILCSTTFASEKIIHDFFSYSNEFVVLLSDFSKKCGGTPLKEECHHREYEIKQYTLIKMESILSSEYYGYWQTYLLNSFYSDAYNIIYPTKVHKVMCKGDYYIVMAEDPVAVYTYKMVVTGNRITTRKIIKKLKK